MTVSTAKVSEDATVVHTTRVACDGNAAAGLGHPRVYLTFAGAERKTVCPYCSHSFVLAEGATDGHGH
ncbi:MAG: zinc-finger domain-containing protein [Actinomycetota bacterium]